MKKTSTYRSLLSLLSIGLIVLISGCKSTDSATAMADKAALDRLVTQLEAQAFRIDVDAVFPFNTAATTQVLNKVMVPTTGSSSTRIEVSGAGHYLEIQGDNIKASLPYFGEQRQSANSYGKANAGVVIDGTFEDYQMTQDEAKGRVRITLKADDGNNGVESYDIQITSFPGGHVSLGVFSSHRTSIRYTGTLKSIEQTTAQTN